MMWFKRKESPKSAARISSEDIVRLYGSVLERASYGISSTAAEDELPFEKPVVKAAILAVSQQEGISEEQLQMLGTGFTHLSSFQPNGGEVSPVTNVTCSTDEERVALARNISQAAPRMKQLADASFREMLALSAEWDLYISKLKAQPHA